MILTLGILFLILGLILAIGGFRGAWPDSGNEWLGCWLVIVGAIGVLTWWVI